jgi:hypothetical protein
MSFANEPIRLAFMEARDGVEKTVEFCRQSIKMYRVALRKFARQPMYRRQFIESLLVFRRYIRSHS